MSSTWLSLTLSTFYLQCGTKLYMVVNISNIELTRMYKVVECSICNELQCLQGCTRSYNELQCTARLYKVVCGCFMLVLGCYKVVSFVWVKSKH